MEKINDCSHLTFFPDKRIFLHAQGNKLFLFNLDTEKNKAYGYEAEITRLNGITTEQLIFHDYKIINVHVDDYYHAEDICGLLAINESSDAIILCKHLSTVQIESSLRHCCNHKENKGIIITRNDSTYWKLDPDTYNKLIILGYYKQLNDPYIVLTNVRKLKTLRSVVCFYIEQCTHIPPEFIQWLGLKNATKFRARHGEGLLDIAIKECRYDTVEYLAKQGLSIKSFTAKQSEYSPVDFRNYKTFFNAYNNLCNLLESKNYSFTQSGLYNIMLGFIYGIGFFSDLYHVFIPNPALDVIRKLDNKFCAFLDRLFKYMPAEVFSINNNNDKCILLAAVRCLNLFPKSFAKVLEKSSPADVNNNGHSIFHEFTWDYYRICPSWLNLNQLERYMYLMTEDEKTCFVDGLKNFMGNGFDYKKAEAGALLMQLICKRVNTMILHKREKSKIDSLIFDLLEKAGSDYVNPGGISPLLAASLGTNSDIEFIDEIYKRCGNINKKDIYGMSPLEASLYKQRKIQVFKFLLEMGADPSVLKADNSAVCMMAIKFFYNSRFEEEEWHVFDSIEDKSFLTALGKDGKSPFLLALEARNLGAVRYLGKGGFIRKDEIYLLLEKILEIKNDLLREEILEMVRTVENSNE